MKCINCGSEWQASGAASVTITNCPFCGESPIVKKEEQKTFEDTKGALAAIYKQFGADVLLGKLNAYIADFAPSLSTADKRLVNSVFEFGASKVLKENINSSQEDKERAVKIAVRTMTESYVAPDIAQNIICEFTDALGWKIDKAAPVKKEAEKPAPSISAASQKPSPVAAVNQKPSTTGVVNKKPSSSGTHLIELNIAFRDRQGKQMVQHITPFSDSFLAILLEVLNCNVKPCKIYLKSTTESIAGVGACVSFTGDISGRLLINMTKDDAVFVSNLMIGEELIKETAKELANMTAGQAAVKLKGLGININFADSVFFDNDYIEKCSNLPFEALIAPFNLSA